jgi:hypothetical protein
MNPKLTLLLLLLTTLLTEIQGQEVALKVENVNVLYRLVENSVKIVIEKQPVRNIVARAKYGTLTPGSKPGEYRYYTDDCSLYEEIIYVGVKTGKGARWFDTTSYRVLSPLPPTLFVSGLSTGVTHKQKLLERPKLQLFLVEYLINPTPKFTVDTFSVEVHRNDSLIYSEYNIAGDTFSPELIRFISDSDPGYTMEFLVISWRNLWNDSIPGCKGEIARETIKVEQELK